MTVRELYKWAEEHGALDLPLKTLSYDEDEGFEICRDPKDPYIFWRNHKNSFLSI